MEIKITKPTQAQLLDDKADEVGVALSKVEWAIRELFGELNFLDVPEEQQSELEKNLNTLAHVRDLVAIAAEIYPYPYGDDRE